MTVASKPQSQPARGRPETPLDPEQGPVQRFAWELRQLRYKAGRPSYESMAEQPDVFCSAATLSRAARGKTLPDEGIVRMFAIACGEDPDLWVRRRAAVERTISGRPAPPGMAGGNGRSAVEQSRWRGEPRRSWTPHLTALLVIAVLLTSRFIFGEEPLTESQPPVSGLGVPEVTVTFERNTAALSEDAINTLKQVISTLGKEAATAQARIVGHASSDEQNGVELSRQRAAVVARQLQMAGISPNHIVVVPKGTDEPLVEEYDASGSINPRAAEQNRRVVVTLDLPVAKAKNSLASLQHMPVSAPVAERAPRVTVTVYNRVTNGISSMREDAPAYLSGFPKSYCRAGGCALPDTEVSTGEILTAECQVQGGYATNGQEHSTDDDDNPGLFGSKLWYGIRWPDDRFGYISEVWIQPADRGGLGLPSC